MGIQEVMGFAQLGEALEVADGLDQQLAAARDILKICFGVEATGLFRMSGPKAGRFVMVFGFEHRDGASILKIDRSISRGKLRREVRFQARMARRFEELPGFGVPEIEAIAPDLRAVVMAAADGVTLSQIVSGKGGSLLTSMTAMERAGRWLQLFHHCVNPRRRVFDLSKDLADMAALSTEMPVGDRADFARGLARLESLYRGVEGRLIGAGLVHGDYHGGNVILAQDVTSGVDLGHRQRGYFVRDLGYFLVTTTLKLRGAAGVDATDRDAFLGGYGAVDAEVLDCVIALISFRIWAQSAQSDRETFDLLRDFVVEGSMG